MSKVSKTFFLYELTIAACLKSLTSQIFSPKEKKALCFNLFFFYLKRGNLKAASLAYINGLLTRTLDKMIKALKIRLNGQKLGLKSKTN